ncbi:MAG: GNAT family N-acetyltransferase [Clostridia bacterium]|nr:GNAT family N-acetyltransferase [Clostridia bacterium]
MKIERLGAEHYDEILALLNAVFGRKNGKEMNFELEMPKMCARDDEHMSKHFGIFDGGRLVACMSVYPFDAFVFGKHLKFATTGNVAVHWDYEGRGYMGAILDYAMSEVERLDIDVARLGGLRSRYNRYGFEACGQGYNFTFTDKNREKKMRNYNSDLIFKEITPSDTEWLAFSAKLYNSNGIYVPRDGENIYKSLTMWRNIPYIAFSGDTPIGYLSAKNGGDIAEAFGIDIKALGDVICSWQKRCACSVRFSLEAHQLDAIRLFSAVCESFSLDSPSHFKICNFEKTVDAFLKLKASYQSLPSGEVCIGIEDYGTIRLVVDGKDAFCEHTEKSADITLDKLSAHRYLFGPYSPSYTAEASYLAEAWLPLPLSWNGQDRV